MIVLISVDKDYNNYSEFADILQEIQKKLEFREFCCLDNDLCDRYHTEHRPALQKFKIDWGNLSGAKRGDIKTNKWGKEYNSKAPAVAAEKICKYATHIIEFGKGDYSISQASKDFNLTKIEVSGRSNSVSKRYNF